MPISIRAILSFLNEAGYRYRYTGSFDIEINGFCALSEIRHGCITWVKNTGSYDFIDKSSDLGVIFVTQFFPDKKITGSNNIIQCKDPKEIYFEILKHFFVKNKEAGIEADSIIETDCIGKNVSIGHHCYINNKVIIGDNVIIKNNVVIECPTEIGAHTIIWSGVVIGTDGFGYYPKEDGHNYKVPHLGGVKIGENVEIGANTCIDRGTLADTIIGNNVKIDNLCHIAHNVIIENDVMLTASVTLAGSSIVKENVYIAPGAIVLNQVTINKRAFVTVGAVTMKDVCENTVVFGNPARFLRNNNEDI